MNIAGFPVATALTSLPFISMPFYTIYTFYTAPYPFPCIQCILWFTSLPSHRVFVGELLEGRVDGGLKLLFAHFVLALEALFGSHLLEAKKVYFAMFSIAVLSKEIRSSDVPSR